MSDPLLHVKATCLLLLVVGIVVPVSSAVAAESRTQNAFDGVPSNYAECMRTSAAYTFSHATPSTQGRSQLQCEYVVRGGVMGQEFAEGDKAKFDECQRKGGTNPTYEIACGLVFYNPDYVFPKDFHECVKEKKGDFTTFEHRCSVEVVPRLAYDKDVATRLIRECRQKGGTYEEMSIGPRCYLEFTEPSR